MLPRNIQFLVVMIAHAINERMARQVDYLLDVVARKENAANFLANLAQPGLRFAGDSGRARCQGARRALDGLAGSPAKRGLATHEKPEGCRTLNNEKRAASPT
jgi:hypothetical protein